MRQHRIRRILEYISSDAGLSLCPANVREQHGADSGHLLFSSHFGAVSCCACTMLHAAARHAIILAILAIVCSIERLG